MDETPATEAVRATGSDIGIDAAQSDRYGVRLIERVLPAGRAAASVAKLDEALDQRCYPECCALEYGGRETLEEALAIPKGEAQSCSAPCI